MFLKPQRQRDWSFLGIFGIALLHLARLAQTERSLEIAILGHHGVGGVDVGRGPGQEGGQ